MLGLTTDWVTISQLRSGNRELTFAATYGIRGNPGQEFRCALAGTIAEKIWAHEPTSNWDIDEYGLDDFSAIGGLIERGVFTDSDIDLVNAEVVGRLRDHWSLVERVGLALRDGDGFLDACDIHNVLAQ